MRQDRLALLLAVLALPLVGFHSAFKRHPSAAEIADTSSMLKRSGEWQGRMAPDFELETLTGDPFRLSDHIGREVIVLNFFATWCRPCRSEMPELNRLAVQHQGEPFTLIGIDAEEKRDLVVSFVKDLPVTFPVAIDGSGEVMRKLGVDSFPTTVLIGADGRIQLYQTGAISNVDVAFAGFLDYNLSQIRSGQGVSKEAYVQAAAHEHYALPTPGKSPDQINLAGRAKVIAVAMDCPCGCDRKVDPCGCNTAKKVKARLAVAPLDNRSDADVVRELNREFCMKGME